MYEYELVNACYKLLKDCFRLQPGETICITVDTEGSVEVTEATAQAAVLLGGKPVVIKTPAARGCGKAGDPDLAIDTLVGALSAADCWVEYNKQWIFYSTVFDRVLEQNKKLRYMCLVESSPGLIMRNIGPIDIPTLAEFSHKVCEETRAAKHIRVTTPAGTDIEFDNKPGRFMSVADGATIPGEPVMLPGQISWAPDLPTINGIIVMDGSINPPCGKVDAPVKLTLKKGKVVKVEGGASAKEFEAWLASFNDPNMYNAAHISYGLGPFAKLTGEVVEDERVWGCTEWGIGNVGAPLTPDIPGGIPAASHSDGICLNSTVWLDGKLFLDKGAVVGPTQEIVDLARKLGK